MVDPEAMFRAREALRRDLGKSLADLWRAAYADAQPAGAVRLFARRQGRAPHAQRRARLYRRERRGRRRRHRLRAVRGGRQHDRPPGRADHARQRRRRTSASPRSTSSTTAIRAMRWCSTNGSRRRRCRRATIRRRWSRNWRGTPISRSPTPTARGRWSARSASTSARSTWRAGRGIASSPTSLIALDKLNPQTAAKLLPPLGRWRRFDAARAALMQAELERILATPGLSQGSVRTGVEEPERLGVEHRQRVLDRRARGGVVEDRPASASLAARLGEPGDASAS